MPKRGREEEGGGKNEDDDEEEEDKDDKEEDGRENNLFVNRPSVTLSLKSLLLLLRTYS
jgi:hypothetical protein